MQGLAHLLELHSIGDDLEHLAREAQLDAHTEYAAALKAIREPLDVARRALIRAQGKAVDADIEATAKELRDAAAARGIVVELDDPPKIVREMPLDGAFGGAR